MKLLQQCKKILIRFIDIVWGGSEHHFNEINSINLLHIDEFRSLTLLILNSMQLISDHWSFIIIKILRKFISFFYSHPHILVFSHSHRYEENIFSTTIANFVWKNRKIEKFGVSLRWCRLFKTERKQFFLPFNVRGDKLNSPSFLPD